MFDTQATDLPLKPLTLYVRLAVFALASCVGTGYAQVSTQVAAQDPTPASTAVTKSKNTVVINKRTDALPYCSDTPADVLKTWPQGSTSAVGDTLKGSMNDTLILKGKGCVVREDIKMQGDTIQYDYPTEQVVATGNAVLRTKIGDEVSGPSVTYNLSTETGHAAPAEFKIGSTGGRGKAESLNVLSSRRALMKKAYYTTCRAEDPDWYLKSDSMLIDQDRDIGMGSGSVLVFKNVPILASPYMEFPLGDKRRSGLLTPTMGVSSKSGVDITIPYYFNLAPNYDLTLYPGFMSKRGAKLGAEYRYMTRHSTGNLFGNFVLNDKLADRNRWYYRAQHQTTGELGGGTWIASVDAQRASDDAYLDDFNAPDVDGSTRILASEYALQYNWGNWQARLRTKTNQTLQNSDKNIDVPYDFEPQLSVTGSERWGNFIASVDYESTRFTHPDKVNRAQGWRHVIYPSLRYEYRNAGFFFTPKIGVHTTQYDLSYVPNNTYDKNASRVVPIASVDSGLIFERDSSWLGRDAVQTLEPRFYYVYSPYRDQNNIWNFDSALADFDLSRIYSENLFTGRDRISSANQATIGATSRWLAQDTGEELFQITAAQRHYFTEQRVTLPGGSINTDRKSDVLLSASGQIAPQFYMDAFGQYNVDNGKLLKTDFSLRWQPAPKKVINIGFNDNRILATPTRTAYISGQWPLTPISKNLYGVARVNYNLEEKHLADAFVGFEYLKDCWIFRIVGQRTISSTRKADNSVFFQLELKGLGALGNDPDKVISDGVAGYSDIKFVDEEIEPAPLKQSNR